MHMSGELWHGENVYAYYPSATSELDPEVDLLYRTISFWPHSGHGVYQLGLSAKLRY
jgi:hypothetical protein